MRTVQSSHLQAIDYNADSQTLVVQFANGAIYTYAGVPLTEWHNMSQAGSPGRYFWDKIRYQYPTTLAAPGVKKKR